ncbi:MAG: hypothetical protein L0I06_02960, partial [Acidipropionibacterium jensenii]|uniref:hypothetical protein n=3 Tax=Acidipropionibacterium jensenii TaxID=1749 RepID=UPI002648591B
PTRPPTRSTRYTLVREEPDKSHVLVFFSAVGELGNFQRAAPFLLFGPSHYMSHENTVDVIVEAAHGVISGAMERGRICRPSSSEVCGQLAVSHSAGCRTPAGTDPLAQTRQY